MSKTQTLIWTIVCVGAAIFCLVIGLGIVSPACFVVGAGFGLRCCYQFLRDYGLAHAVDESQDKVEATPMITSPGSNRLFVPPPLDKR